MFNALKKLLSPDTANSGHTVKGCACCGRCCEYFGGHLNATPHDLERWKREGRDDLLARVNRLGWIWVDPQSGRLEAPCPFIGKNADNRGLCLIHDTKPDICRDYPTLAHGHRCLSGVFLKR